MIQIGTQVIYQGEVYTISNAREFLAGQYIYTLKSDQGKIINSYESNFRVIQSKALIEKVANKLLSQPSSFLTTTSKELFELKLTKANYFDEPEREFEKELLSIFDKSNKKLSVDSMAYLLRVK